MGRMVRSRLTVSELGTAAALDVPRSGNATVGELVRGSDSRLTDARTAAAHTHPAADISDSTATGRSVLTAASAAAALTTLGVSSFAQTVLDDTTASTARATLGLPGVSSDAATGALTVPQGTTAQRPGSPTLADFRGNSTIGIGETYQYSAWAALATNRPLLRRVDLATPSSLVTLTSISGWTVWEIELNAVTTSVAGANIWLQFSTDNGSTWVATFYDYLHSSAFGSTASVGTTTAATAILVTGAVAASTPAQARIRLSGGGTATRKFAMIDYGVDHHTNGLQRGQVYGTWTAATTAVNAVSLFATSGTLGGGTVCLYGSS